MEAPHLKGNCRAQRCSFVGVAYTKEVFLLLSVGTCKACIYRIIHVYTCIYMYILYILYVHVAHIYMYSTVIPCWHHEKSRIVKARRQPDGIFIPLCISHHLTTHEAEKRLTSQENQETVSVAPNPSRVYFHYLPSFWVSWGVAVDQALCSCGPRSLEPLGGP